MCSNGDLEPAPFRRAQCAVVEHAREQQQHESHHRGRNRAAFDQPGAEWPQPDSATGAGSYLDWRKTRECAEHRRENLAAFEPALAAEQEHAGEGQKGIGEGEPRDEVRHGGVRVDELDPRERQQQNERGPDAERGRIR